MVSDRWLNGLQLYYDNLNSDDEFRAAFEWLAAELVEDPRGPGAVAKARGRGASTEAGTHDGRSEVLDALDTLDRIEPFSIQASNDPRSPQLREDLRRRLATFGRDQYLPEDFGSEDMRHSLWRYLAGPSAWTSLVAAPASADPSWARYQERTERMQPAVDEMRFNRDGRLLVIGDRPGLDEYMPRDHRAMTMVRSRKRAADAPRLKLRTDVWMAWRLYRATRGDNASAIADEENRLKAEGRLPPRLELWMLDAATGRAFAARERARRRDLASFGLPGEYPPLVTFEDFLMIPPVDLSPWDLGIGRGPNSIRDEVDEIVSQQRQRLSALSSRPTTVDAVQDSVRSWCRTLKTPKPHPTRAS